MTFQNSALPVMAGLVAAFFASCGSEVPVVEITETRTVESLPKKPAPDATSAQRFGYEQRDAAQVHRGGPATAEPAELPFTWTVPEGWRQAPARPMRVVTFEIGANNEAECYITILGASGGGIEANINRWRMQMGQKPLSAEEVAALPAIEVLGQPSKWIEIDGPYSGQSGESLQNATLRGLVCPVNEFSVFVKMIGPASVVGPQRANFLAFCQSLTWSESANQ
ncbi:MAG: hypothetical protein U9Q79_05730 [Candidatus Hydrogenedentes bacterium]|nr:hypothetical protein [Candidatus Hydrogenedentota bacterium]